MMKAWNSEVSSRDLIVWVVLRDSGEVSDQNNQGCLSKGPVDLHGPERDGVGIVHQRVRVRHLYSFSK